MLNCFPLYGRLGIYMKKISLFFIGLCVVLCSCGHDSSTTTNVDNGTFNLGVEVNHSIKMYLSKTEKADKKLASYGNHEVKMIDSVNYVAENDPVISGQQSIASNSNIKSQSIINPNLIKALFSMIQNNTIPQLTDALGNFLKTVESDQDAISALRDYCNSKNGTDAQDYTEIFYRVLNYKKSEELWHTFAQLIQQNPAMLRNIFSLVHDYLITLPDNESAVPFFTLLSQPLVSLKADLGKPIWIAKLDVNDNPIVLSFEDQLYPPFIDWDFDGICDVDDQGNPIDENGKVIDIPAFGQQVYKDKYGKILVERDSLGRAISATTGDLIYHYYDAKATFFALLLRNIGSFLEKGLVEDYVVLLDTALKPVKQYQDDKGTYNGYSDESVSYHALMNILEMLKSEKCRNFLNCFPAFFAENKDPHSIGRALIGFGQLFWDLRDNPDIVDVASLEAWFANLPNNPPMCLMPMLQLMSQTSSATSSSMAMDFLMWIGTEYPMLAQGFWPVVQSLRNIHEAKPGLVEKVYNNTIMWLSWAIIHEIRVPEAPEGLPILSILLNKVLPSLNENTAEKVAAMQQSLTNAIRSRYMYMVVQGFLRFTSFPVIREALVALFSPQSHEKYDAYSSLVRLSVRSYGNHNHTMINIRLARMIGKVFDPELAVVENLLQAIVRWGLIDEDMAIIKIVQNAVDQYNSHSIPPICVFGTTYIDILKAGDYITKEGNFQNRDVEEILNGISSFLLEETYLLQRLYALIQMKAE